MRLKDKLLSLWNGVVLAVRRTFLSRKFRSALREAFISAVLVAASEVLEKDYTPAKVKSSVRASLGRVLKTLRLTDGYANYLDEMLFPVIDQLVDRYYPDRMFILNELERHLRKVI